MDVRLSSEHIALRDSAAQVVADLGPHTVKELDDAERAAKLDAAVTAAGWRELRTPSETGAPWASAVEVAMLAEELARGLADVPFLGPTLAAELRRLAGAPASSSNETIALSWDLGSLANATIAIDTRGATSALVVDHEQVSEVVVSQAPTTVDLTRPSAAIDRSTATSVGGSTLTADGLTRWTALGLALTSADLVGAMRGAVQLASDHAASRRQYGVAIGSFQAVQHMLADAHVAAEGSRSVTLHAAWAVDALDPAEALSAAAVAKAYSARAARAVCETAIQVHGGMGNTWECLAHVYLRRALLSSDVLGGVGPSLDRVLEHHGIGGVDGFR
jgi:alkylation response protein AidB-like acyl-CoA dehydrogenase